MIDRIESSRSGSSLAIGYGNPLRGDDGVGWHVAALLDARQEGEQIETIACQQLMPELAERISRARGVYFVDATYQGTPGEWSCESIQPNAGTSLPGHVSTPEGILAMARELFDAAPVAYLFTICGACFEFREQLSPDVTAAAPSVAAAIVNLSLQQTRNSLPP
jgi:hydrogenase maturation protease